MNAGFLIGFASTIFLVARAGAEPPKVYEETGDYIIGGLMPVYEEGCSILRELETLHRLEAMAYAVRRINARSDILPNVTLGFRIYDTCSYEPITMERATLFIPDASINLGTPASCENPPEDWKPVLGKRYFSLQHLLDAHNTLDILFVTRYKLRADKKFAF